MAKTTDRLHGYARLGAAIRRAEIVAELHAIDKAFPDLRFQKRTATLLKTRGSITSAASATTEDEPVGRKRRKKRKAHAGRKEIHQRTNEEILGGTKEERSLIKRPERPARCETPRLAAQATAVISASCSL
jgi:hypothetical protein